MEQVNKQEVAAFRQRIEADLSLKSDIKKLLDFLPNCEYELILYMVEKKKWSGAVPPPPDGFEPGDGSIELGLFLYWFNNPDQLNLQEFNFSLKEEILILTIILGLDYLLPKTKFNKINYGFFSSGSELIYIDGSVLGTKKYANFDQGWFIAFINLIETVTRFLWYSGNTFPSTPPPSIPLTGAIEDTVSIAVLGDWGAGDSASEAVMNQIKSLNPDYILHVGDVYYAGTPLASSPNGGHYFLPGEEYKNLLDLWPQSHVGKSFTLNSNHEMYSGANGLFHDALGAANNPVGSNTPFSAQQGASCFALTYAGWTLLGLDSAYMGSFTDAFMVGSIGDATGFQTQWIQQKLTINPDKTIVFTHHNGFADDCTSASPLWREVQGALKGDPFAWYWGHIHNGIVYKSPITIPTPKEKPNSKKKQVKGFTTNTYARCLGHAALPYGIASSLADKPIAWKADNLQPSPSEELYNGFAIITLTSKSGQMQTITERFYDTSQKPQPVYEKPLL